MLVQDLATWDIHNPELIHADPSLQVDIVTCDGSVRLPIRMAIFNQLMAKPYFDLKIPIRSVDIIKTEPTFGKTMLSEIQTKQYAYLAGLVCKPTNRGSQPHMKIIKSMAEVINLVDNYANMYFSFCTPSMSILSLAKLAKHPKIKRLMSMEDVPESASTRDIESAIKAKLGRLVDLILSDEISYEDGNVLKPFFKCNLIKANQLAQFLIAYGPRSDIDDRVLAHPVKSSAIKGLTTIHELAVEMIGAKKASYCLDKGISDTAHFSRLVRLAVLKYKTASSKDCGSTITVPIVLKKHHIANYDDKIVYLNGERVVVGPKTYAKLSGQLVDMISPTGCRCSDGVCIRCLGRESPVSPWIWMPPIRHLSLLASYYVSESTNQTVISGKHHVGTETIPYKLPIEVIKCLKHSRLNLTALPAFVKVINEGSLVIRADALGHIADLGRPVAYPNMYSKVSDLVITTNKGEVLELPISNERIVPFFSGAMLSHIYTVRGSITHTSDGFLIIPLEGFDFTKPICSTLRINEDIIALVERIDQMLRTDISKYTSLSDVLHDFTEIVYKRFKINVMWCEILLRSFIQGVVNDPNNVTFRTLSEANVQDSISGKLAQQSISISRYFSDISTSVDNRGSNILDPYFGILK